jgi:hypothetical protein
MPTKTRLIPIRAKLAIGALILVGGFAYQTTTNQASGPRDVNLTVTWNTSRGVDLAQVSWSVSARYTAEVVMESGDGKGESAAGGAWHRHVVLPGPGTWMVVLTGSPVRALKDGVYRGASSTCIIKSGKSRVADIGSSAPNDGCAVTLVVIVGPND